MTLIHPPSRPSHKCPSTSRVGSTPAWGVSAGITHCAPAKVRGRARPAESTESQGLGAETPSSQSTAQPPRAASSLEPSPVLLLQASWGPEEWVGVLRTVEVWKATLPWDTPTPSWSGAVGVL